jgi:hypothetical protein
MPARRVPHGAPESPLVGDSRWGRTRPDKEIGAALSFRKTRMTIDTSRRGAIVGFGALADGAAALASTPSRALRPSASSRPVPRDSPI